MRWAFRSDKPEDAGAKARRLHSEWLTRALAEGREYPRIPRRPMDDGGFGPLMAKPNGRQLVERWWRLALGRVDD